MQKFVLEKYRIFPYVAWGLVIGFALIVYQMINNIAATASTMSDTSSRLEARAKQPVESITDFSR